MYFFYAALMFLISYLSGSVNYAIILTRIIKGKDIREMGNLNPGMLNVLHSIGKGWGIFIGFLDSLKSFLPILFASIFLFPQNNYSDFFILLGMGICAIAGHRFPVFYQFKGGKAFSCFLGAILYFLPIETLLSLSIGLIIVKLFIKNVEYRTGRWVPIIAVIVLPFLTLSLNYIISIPLFAHVSLGGHPWYFIAGSFVLCLVLLSINLTFMKKRMVEYKSKKNKE